jgi:hypothetical protein
MIFRYVYRWGIVMILGITVLSGCGGATPTPILIASSPTPNSAPVVQAPAQVIVTEPPPPTEPVSAATDPAETGTELTPPGEGTATEEAIATQANPLDLPFLMKIDRISVIVGRGTLLEGRVTHGTLFGGEEVDILGSLQTQPVSTDVLAVLISNIIRDQVTVGDYAGILVENVETTSISPGMLLSAGGEYDSYDEALQAFQQ